MPRDVLIQRAFVSRKREKIKKKKKEPNEFSTKTSKRNSIFYFRTAEEFVRLEFSSFLFLDNNFTQETKNPLLGDIDDIDSSTIGTYVLLLSKRLKSGLLRT